MRGEECRQQVRLGELHSRTLSVRTRPIVRPHIRHVEAFTPLDEPTTSNTDFSLPASRQVAAQPTLFVHPSGWLPPPSTPTFPYQQADKSPHNQHVMSLNPTNADRPGRPDPRRRHGHARSPGIPVESRGWERRRRDLNPRGAMHPYLLSREAHSTGLCDVSSADYSRPFSPRARTAPAASAQEAVGTAEGEGFEPPVPLLTQRFSRPSLSATQTALQTCLILQERAAQCRQREHRRREAHDRKRTHRQAGDASVGSS